MCVYKLLLATTEVIIFSIPLIWRTSSLGLCQVSQQHQLILPQQGFSFAWLNAERHPERSNGCCKRWIKRTQPNCPHNKCTCGAPQFKALTAADASRLSCASWRPRLCWLDMKCPEDGCLLAETACQFRVDRHKLCFVTLKPCRSSLNSK